MNPLAITPAFTGEVKIPQAALLERDEVVSTSKQIQGIESNEDYARAAEAMRGLNGLEKVTENGRLKEKRPYLDFGALIDSFAKKFLAPVDSEIERIQPMMDKWAAKLRDEKLVMDRKVAEDKRKADEALANAQKQIETAETPEKKLAAQLAAEEAIITRKAVVVVAPAKTPQGVGMRVSYDFEITDAHKLIAKKSALFRWKEGPEEFHFDRITLRKMLNSETPNEYTGWRPPEDTQSVVMSDYGIRVFVSVKTNVRS